jgi:type I restriction enzyme, R subunit
MPTTLFKSCGKSLAKKTVSVERSPIMRKTRYDQPYRRRDLTFKMIRELIESIVADKPTLAPLSVWRAYELLEKVSGQPKNEFVALVSLIRKVVGVDATLTSYDKTVDRNCS